MGILTLSLASGQNYFEGQWMQPIERAMNVNGNECGGYVGDKLLPFLLSLWGPQGR